MSKLLSKVLAVNLKARVLAELKNNWGIEDNDVVDMIIAFAKESPTLSVSTCSPLVSSVFFELPHSFRVYFPNFSTRFECIF